MKNMEQQKQLRVLLWTAPRCMSSAFERSIRELQGVKVIYEPHQSAYLNEKSSMNGYTLYTDNSYEHADNVLLEDYSNFNAVWCKNMALFIPSDRIHLYLQGKFSSYQHTFLVRNPRLSVPSRWRLCVKHGFEFGGVSSTSFSKLFEIFEQVRSTSPDVVVVDATDLLSDPAKIMEQYCLKTGLPYDRSMLTWTPGVVEDWTMTKKHEIWHGGAMNSFGFEAPKSDASSTETLPPEVEEEIQKSMPYYEAMYKHRIQLV